MLLKSVASSNKLALNRSSGSFTRNLDLEVLRGSFNCLSMAPASSLPRELELFADWLVSLHGQALSCISDFHSHKQHFFKAFRAIRYLFKTEFFTEREQSYLWKFYFSFTLSLFGEGLKMSELGNSDFWRRKNVKYVTKSIGAWFVPYRKNLVGKINDLEWALSDKKKQSL